MIILNLYFKLITVIETATRPLLCRHFNELNSEQILDKTTYVVVLASYINEAVNCLLNGLRLGTTMCQTDNEWIWLAFLQCKRYPCPVDDSLCLYGNAKIKFVRNQHFFLPF